LVPILAYRDHPLLIVGDMEGMPLRARLNGIRPNGQTPLLYVALGDGDQWGVEAEWPDGSIEPIRTFKAQRAIQDWLGHRSIQHTVRYTELTPIRFKDFWRD
jgi:hypothetical protein